MCRHLLLFVLLFSSLSAKGSVEIDWEMDCFRAKETEEGFVIEFDAKVQAGRKIVLTGIESYTGSENVVLWYQTVHSIPESYRHRESLIIRWKVAKDDFLKWKAERKFLLKKKDGIHLTEDQIKEIKKAWK